MSIKSSLVALCLGLALTTSASAETDGIELRKPSETARDEYRHPQETLSFFQVEADHTVVEIWPGGGWYTAILAPMLKDKGQLIAAH